MSKVTMPKPVAYGIKAANTGEIVTVLYGSDVDQVGEYRADLVVPLYTTPQPAEPVKTLVDNQEPLGEEFQRVLDEHSWDLYVKTTESVKVNAIFETENGEAIGTTNAKVKRVEWQDDGSLTVVIDYWPQPAKPVKQSLPPLHFLPLSELRELAMRDCSEYSDDDLAIAWELFDRLVEGGRITDVAEQGN